MLISMLIMIKTNRETPVKQTFYVLKTCVKFSTHIYKIKKVTKNNKNITDCKFTLSTDRCKIIILLLFFTN